MSPVLFSYRCTHPYSTFSTSYPSPCSMIHVLSIRIHSTSITYNTLHTNTSCVHYTATPDLTRPDPTQPTPLSFFPLFSLFTIFFFLIHIIFLCCTYSTSLQWNLLFVTLFKNMMV
ncbi:hypothetical protein GYMLUDRAFT_738867 [Collybiopsis luxurians FD-317 M1]|uniref:Uncharacterized protein n=1 Tax=Collybiopsis luxurians FD-317 M1 TaxID=944289 RepID=A0A0D0CI59_9AGAR|nr:hypothetical protein GYMLUDRAFT_738867 [Collybiopsis luxurians FD-317 M1]